MRTFIKNMIRIKFKPLNLIPVNTIVSRQLETLLKYTYFYNHNVRGVHA